MPGFRNGRSRTTAAGCTRSAIYRFVHLQIPVVICYCCTKVTGLLPLNCLRIAAGKSESSENQTTAKPADLWDDQFFIQVFCHVDSFFSWPLTSLWIRCGHKPQNLRVSCFKQKLIVLEFRFWWGHLSWMLLERSENKPYFLCASDVSISLCLIKAENLPSCLFNAVT